MGTFLVIVSIPTPNIQGYQNGTPLWGTPIYLIFRSSCNRIILQKCTIYWPKGRQHLVLGFVQVVPGSKNPKP